MPACSLALEALATFALCAGLQGFFFLVGGLFFFSLEHREERKEEDGEERKETEGKGRKRKGEGGEGRREGYLP